MSLTLSKKEVEEMGGRLVARADGPAVRQKPSEVQQILECIQELTQSVEGLSDIKIPAPIVNIEVPKSESKPESRAEEWEVEVTGYNSEGRIKKLKFRAVK